MTFFNLVDFLILGVILYYAFSGYFHGFVRVITDIFALVASFMTALFGYKQMALFLERYGFSQNYSQIIAFFLLWLLIEVLIFVLIQLFYNKLPEKIRKSRMNSYLGIAPALFKGIFVTAIFLTVLVSLPLPGKVREDVNSSFFGKQIVARTGFLEPSVENIFKDKIKIPEYTIIEPKSNETIELGYKQTETSVDKESENKMLELINEERAKAGLQPVVLDEDIQKVARDHSEDMFEKGYFAHLSKEGKTPFDRLKEGGIKFATAGENLALAPDVYIAHKGLMDSPGHKANILTPEYKKVGIGVIDGGKYGKMFTQDFTD
ncbi:MAG: CvpA family protein [Patescibacteria group bacterium]|nr:CvpA family protein [Patescibacteria group bacterium]